MDDIFKAISYNKLQDGLDPDTIDQYIYYAIDGTTVKSEVDLILNELEEIYSKENYNYVQTLRVADQNKGNRNSMD